MVRICVRCSGFFVFLFVSLGILAAASNDDYLYANLENVLSRHPVDLELLENDNLRMLYKRAVTPSSPPPTEASTLLLASNSTEIPIPVTKSTIELKKSTKQLPTVMITDIRKKLRINETTPKSDATSPLPIIGNVTLEPSFNNNNNYTEDDLNDREELFPSDIDTESGEKQFNETLAHHNITRSRTDKFEYYNSSFHNDPALGHYYWVDMDNRSDVKINELLSHSHRRAATVKLSFEFPFYGHFVKNITIATGGFLYTGDYVHSWLAATQYIAPLMANFDTSLSTDNFIKHVDNGTAFTVEWQKVSLQEKPNEKFTFQVTLLKNGDIIFVYKNISISVKDIQDDNHPVKVGLSDAYILDRTIFFIRRKTIFEYHRVDFAEKDIKNWTVIYLKALPTCLHNFDCHTCLTRKVFSSSKCIWCPTLNKCSDGFDRHRQHWTANECDKKGFKNETMCSQGNKTIESLFNQYNVPDVEFDSAKASQVYLNRNTNKQQDDVGVSGIIAILFLVAMVSGLAIWVFYAYRNPHTTSGQILIRYRPSQWRWRRGEARYTAATIHM